MSTAATQNLEGMFVSGGAFSCRSGSPRMRMGPGSLLDVAPLLHEADPRADAAGEAPQQRAQHPQQGGDHHVRQEQHGGRTPRVSVLCRERQGVSRERGFAAPEAGVWVRVKTLPK